MKGLAASERFELVAVADLREKARREAEASYPGIRTFASHEEMFAHCQPDIVCVSTWPPSHLEVTRDALDLPLKGILVEKPLADNSGDGLEILERVRAKRLPLVVPHGLLVAEHVRQIIDLVQQGRIGDLKLVEIECTGWDILNAGVHWLNFFVVLTRGEAVEWVMACCDTRTRTYRDGMQVETAAATYVQTRSGVRAVMNTGDYVKISHEGVGVLFRLVGTRGTVEFYGWEPCYRLLNEAHPRGRLIQVDPGPKTAHQRYLEALADQIDRGQPDYVVAESSLAALELCEAAYLSCKHGCMVSLPLSQFVVPPPAEWEAGRPYSGQGGGRDGRKLPPLDA
jgi:predicted dehydrogenase